MDKEPLTVRCIFGSGIQQQAEESGLKGWCDEHCHDGQRGDCFWMLKERGIRAV